MIMKLTYQKGKADKIHISIDGEYAFTVDEMYFSSFYLKNGQDISPEDFAKLKEAVSIRRAYNCAVGLLSRRDHSEKELLGKLREKGFSDGATEALEKLKNSGYVDDERFCRFYAGELIRMKDYGKRRIEQELYRKGVSREIVSAVLEEFDFDSAALADIIKRKYLSKMSDEKGKRRAIDALMRRGYSYSEIRNALAQINSQENFEVYDE